MFELIRKDLSGLGGPMGTEYTTVEWRKYFDSFTRAIDYAENDLHGAINWKKVDKYKQDYFSGDLGYCAYYIREVKAETEKDSEKSVPYNSVLRSIRNNLEYVDQWAESSHWNSTMEYASKAKALIELLEVHNCGSTGGFDKGQRSFRDYPDNPFKYVGREMWHRFYWLEEKAK